jgi:hypothetical protein
VLRLPSGGRHRFAYQPWFEEDDRIAFLEEAIGPKL